MLASRGIQSTSRGNGVSMIDVRELIEELRGFAEGSESARATLMRDAAYALEEMVTAMEEQWYQRDLTLKVAIQDAYDVIGSSPGVAARILANALKEYDDE